MEDEKWEKIFTLPKKESEKQIFHEMDQYLESTKLQKTKKFLKSHPSCPTNEQTLRKDYSETHKNFLKKIKIIGS